MNLKHGLYEQKRALEETGDLLEPERSQARAREQELLDIRAGNDQVERARLFGLMRSAAILENMRDIVTEDIRRHYEKHQTLAPSADRLVPILSELRRHYESGGLTVNRYSRPKELELLGPPADGDVIRIRKRSEHDNGNGNTE